MNYSKAIKDGSIYVMASDFIKFIILNNIPDATPKDYYQKPLFIKVTRKYFGAHLFYTNECSECLFEIKDNIEYIQCGERKMKKVGDIKIIPEKHTLKKDCVISEEENNLYEIYYIDEINQELEKLNEDEEKYEINEELEKLNEDEEKYEITSKPRGCNYYEKKEKEKEIMDRFLNLKIYKITEYFNREIFCKKFLSYYHRCIPSATKDYAYELKTESLQETNSLPEYHIRSSGSIFNGYGDYFGNNRMYFFDFMDKNFSDIEIYKNYVEKIKTTKSKIKEIEEQLEKDLNEII